MTQTRCVAKPIELIEIAEATADLFELLARWFDMDQTYVVDLSSVDTPPERLQDPIDITAMVMRKLQALRFAARPGIQTASDVIVALISDVERALAETPQRLAALGRAEPVPEEQRQFERHYSALHSAGDAVGRLCIAHGGAALVLE